MTTRTVHEPAYGIGTVSRLTGIPVDTLRAWERRYQVVTPQRTAGNRRFYAREDVTRLQLIKQLVERGHAISSVAALAEPTLRERLEIHLETPVTVVPAERPMRVMIYGDALPFLVESWRSALGSLRVLGTHLRYHEFEQDAQSQRPEALVLEMPALEPETPARLRELRTQCGAERVVVVYSFATKRSIERLQREGVITLRSPITALALREACRLDTEVSPVGVTTPLEMVEELPPRRFDSQTLAALAEIGTGIRCECPHHLADLLFRLNAFETYSAQCESRNEQDAALHAHLHQSAAKARALLEGALDYLIQSDEIDLTEY